MVNRRNLFAVQSVISDYTFFVLSEKHDYIPKLGEFYTTQPDLIIKPIAVYDPITMKIVHVYERKSQTYTYNQEKNRYETLRETQSEKNPLV